MIHSFTVVVDHAMTDDELDRLFAAGGDDSAPEISERETRIHFDRAANSLAEAVTSALLTVATAGLVAVGVHAPDPVQVA
jgi:hypothetical protein